MTLPIAFTPTPTDTDLDPADIELADNPVTTTTDANFAKINTFLRAQKPKIGQTIQAAYLTGTLPVGVWTDFSGAMWPALTMTLPARPQALMVCIGGFIECTISDGRWIAISWRITGGTTYPNDVTELGKRAILHSYELIGTSRVNTIHLNNLTPNGVITITPCFYINGTGSAIQVLGGSLQALALAS